MPIGNSDFARDFHIGAEIGNMRAMRTERMMQLKAQAAHQAMLERQTAAEIEMIMAHRDLYKQQVQEKINKEITDAADLTAYEKMVNYDTEVGGKDPRQARLERLLPLSGVNPDLAKKIGGALKEQAETEAIGQPKPITPYQEKSLDLQNQRLEMEKQTQDRLKGREQRLDEKEKRIAQFQPIRTEISQINKQIDALQRQHDKLEPEQGEVDKHPNTIARMTLSAQIAGLRAKALHLTRQMHKSGGATDEEAASLQGADEQPEPKKASQFEVGKIYKSNGIRARYKEDGSWEKVD